MSNLKSLLAGFLIISALLIVGCSKNDNPVDNNNNNNGGGNTQVDSPYPFPTDFGGVSPAAFLGVIRVSTTETGMSYSAGIGVGSINGEDKGNITVSADGKNYTLIKEQDSTDNSFIYTFIPSTAFPTGIALGSGDTQVSFNVSNYTLSTATVTVPGDLGLTSPTAGATISKSNGLTVSWSSQSGGDNSAVMVTDSQGKSTMKKLTGNSVTFSSSDLSGLSAGPVTVYAYSYNYVLTNNNEAALVGESLSYTSINLQ